MDKLAIITGPTAVGKSAVAVNVAELVSGEIISSDSMQVYRGMDVGTAKIKKQEMYSSKGNLIPHHLLSFLSPDSRFSVAEFKSMAEELIPKIKGRGKLPILVGGTGLYIEALIDPYKFPPIPINKTLRSQLEEEANIKGRKYVHQKLQNVDPVSAKRIHPNDLRRVIRALEVFAHTGKSISTVGRRSPGQAKEKYKLSYIGLTASRSFLYERINKRVEQMIDNGLVEETESLLNAGFSPELPALQGLGYRQIIGYLQNKYSFSEAVDLIKRDTRRYAKRQLTWFKKDDRIQWFNVQEFPNTYALSLKIGKTISRSINQNVEIGNGLVNKPVWRGKYE